MLDVEGQWTDLLAANNITGIVRGLNSVTSNDKADVEEALGSFSAWLQRTAEFTKKELLSLCFSRCQGLWMFLNRYSARRVHKLLQKLRNLITLVQWFKRKLHSTQSWPDYKDTSKTRCSFWIREDRELKRHLWLGRLVEWWSLMGLLPKHQEPNGEKQIAHMWKEMKQSSQKPGEEERRGSVIQGLVTHLVQKHGSLWTPEANGQQCYPPSSLKALLKLALIPHVDAHSAQAVIMYFILDVVKFLQCRNDLFKSFCHTFTIPTSFSRQIRAFWMLDHGKIKTATDLLLSPRTTLPRFSWQHRRVLTSLLSGKEHLLAFRYLRLTSPAVESVEDVKLCAQVLLQNSCVSEAWALIKRSQSEEMVSYFLQACNMLGVSSECVPPGYDVQNGCDTGVSIYVKALQPCPLSAALYQAQRDRTLSTDELLRFLTQAVAELRPPPTCALRELTWPQHFQRESKTDSSEVFLSTEVSFLRSPSPSILETTARNDDYNPEHPDHASSCPSPVPPVHSRRRVSFSSVSSMSPIRKDQTFSYESTVTLQQISALLIHDQEEEEEVSQVSITSEVFPDCHDWTLEVSAAPVLDHGFASHSFRSRFYSTDCCTDLPSLPEEIAQTPTTPTKPVELEKSESFHKYGSTKLNSFPQKGQKEASEEQAVELTCEISLAVLNVDDQTDGPQGGGSHTEVKNDNQSGAPVEPTHPSAHSHLPYMNFTLYKDDTKTVTQADKDFAAGKVSVRSRRTRKGKRVKGRANS